MKVYQEMQLGPIAHKNSQHSLNLRHMATL